jgi:hypothetical protein
MGAIVDDPTINETARHLKKGEKSKRKRKKNHQFWNSRFSGLVVVTSLVSSPVCVFLLGILAAL